jgi:hypothetical protein
LTICRKLVALMGGTLELQSELGVGTRMTVQFAMPIETMDYQIDGLRGRSGIIAINDPCVARALVNFGRALGLKLRVPVPRRSGVAHGRHFRWGRPRISQRHASGGIAAEVARGCGLYRRADGFAADCLAGCA